MERRFPGADPNSEAQGDPRSDSLARRSLVGSLGRIRGNNGLDASGRQGTPPLSRRSHSCILHGLRSGPRLAREQLGASLAAGRRRIQRPDYGLGPVCPPIAEHLPGLRIRRSAMDFSADGALLLSAGRTPIKLWDVATGTCLLNLSVGDDFQSVAFAPDGQHCAVSYGIAPRLSEPNVRIVKLELGHGIRTLYGLQGVLEKSSFSTDGRLMAAASHEWEIGIWERRSGRFLGVLPCPVGRFADSTGMAFDPSGRRFACSVGHEARLWDINQRRMTGRWNLPGGLCDSMAFSGEDHLLLVRQELKSRQGEPTSQFPANKFPRTVRLYDLLSATPTKPLAEIDDFDRGVHCIKIAPNGSVFAVDGVGTDQGNIRRMFRVYDCQSGRQLGRLPTGIRIDRASLVLLRPDRQGTCGVPG